MAFSMKSGLNLMNCPDRLIDINELHGGSVILFLKKYHMIKKIIILTIGLTLVPLINSVAQQTGTAIQREVRLFNPYKPTLSEAEKKSFMPDMKDTSVIRPVFTYSVSPPAFTPVYTITSIRPAIIAPDPLTKLYRSYLNIGVGNYLTPMAELSISSERSKTGMVAFYAKHFSSNGNLELDNNKDVFAGYMDNEASLYGKKFQKSSILSGSVDFAQLSRYAYGYDTSFVDYEAEKADIRLKFIDVGATVALTSLRSDSGRLIYDGRFGYNLFRQSPDLGQQSVSIAFEAGKRIKAFKSLGFGKGANSSDFYATIGTFYDLTFLNAAIEDKARHLVTISPSIGKKSSEWSFNLGFSAVTESRVFEENSIAEYKTRFHLYPDVNLEIAIVPRFLNFNIAFDGRLENNSAPNAVHINPFMVTDGSLFTLPNTNHQIVARAGVSGSVIPSTTYRAGASYTVFEDMLFFSNYVLVGMTSPEGYGNFFVSDPSAGNLANVFAEMTTTFTKKMSGSFRANYYNYSLESLDFPYNKPSWDATVWFKYNLRDKIVAGASLYSIGKRDAFVFNDNGMGPAVEGDTFTLPANLSLNLSAEYRYTKIMSFWIKLNNISTSRYYEWAYYPSQRFQAMIGFSYSL